MNLPHTRAALAKLGYTLAGVEFVVGELTKVLAKYENPQEATRVLEDSFPRVVHSRFGEKHFRAFIRDIDPTVLRGYYPEFNVLEDWEKEEMTKEEIAEFEKERRTIVPTMLARQKKDYRHIAFELEHGRISCHHHVAVKDYRVGEPPRGSAFAGYSIPIGGQPGYHRKMRRR